MGRNQADQEWYSEGLSFECTQCGGCCSGAPGFVWVTDADIRAMASEMGMADSLEKFEQQFVRQVGDKKSLVEYPDGDCIFLDPDKRNCMVYQSRPIQCRTWPFWESNLESPRTWSKTAKSCPGCNHGRLYSISEIRQSKDAGSMHDL